MTCHRTVCVSSSDTSYLPLAPLLVPGGNAIWERELAYPPLSKCPQTPSPSLDHSIVSTLTHTQSNRQAPTERERQTHSSGSRQLPSAWAARLLQSINPQPQSLMRRFISMVLRSLVSTSKGRPWLQKRVRAQEKEDRKLKVPHGLTKVKVRRA